MGTFNELRYRRAPRRERGRLESLGSHMFPLDALGAWPRLCIGRDVALVQCLRIVAELLRRRRVVRPGGAAEVSVDAMVTLRPRGGLPLGLVPSTPGAPRPARC